MTTTITITTTKSSDWRWQLRHAITSPAQLEQHLTLTEEERQGALRAQRLGMPLLIPPYYLELCEPDNPRCPIRQQCVPRIQEADRVPGDLEDPLGEVVHEVAPHLVQRYPDRALLLVSATCAVYCRFCTRSRVVGEEQGVVSLSQLEPAMLWLQQHPQVREVLVSGGDPLVSSTARLVALLERLRIIPSIEVIRLGTRVPVVLPMRIDDELIGALRPFHPLWIMTHFNHPRELTPQATEALTRLVDGGFPVMNHTVLLRGINDDAQVLTELFRGLVRRRVRPYYLLHGDAVGGSAHLRTSLEKSIAIFGQLQGRLSGIALPKLIVDTPGGKGKVPVGPQTIVESSPGRTVLRTYRGEEVEVLDPPDTVGLLDSD